MPPKDADEQAIPKSLEHVIKLKEAAKIGDSPRRRKRRKRNSLICVGVQRDRANLHPKARPEKVTPVFQQKPGESGSKFWHRVTKDTHAFLKETAFEQKYGVQVERNPKTGLIQGLTKHKADRDDTERLRIGRKNTGEQRAKPGEKTLTKREKRKLQLRLKREKRLGEKVEDDEFGRLQDRVAFGEVAHEPPKLKKVTGEERKPKNLLLNSLLEVHKVARASKAIDRSGKRKKLPVAERRKLEKQQNEVIAAYRRLKSQRLADKSN